MEQGCTGSRHRPVAVSYARWSCLTHHEKLTRKPALAPAPGKALRSRESRPRRIYALNQAIRSGTQSESRTPSAGDVGCRLERPCRAEGALSMRAPEDVAGIRLYRIPTPTSGCVVRWTAVLHPSREAHTRASPCPSTREGPAEPWVAAQKDLCSRFGAKWPDAQIYQEPAVLAMGCHLKRPCRAAGALSKGDRSCGRKIWLCRSRTSRGGAVWGALPVAQN